MIEKNSSFRAGVLATSAVATMLFFASGASAAGAARALNGAYAAGSTFSNVGEAKGVEKPAVLLSETEFAAAAAAANVKALVTTTLQNAVSRDVNTAFGLYEGALLNSKNAATTAADAAKDLVEKEAARLAADATVTALGAQKVAAAANVATKNTALDAAIEARTAVYADADSTLAAKAAADAAVSAAQFAADIALAAQAPVVEAYDTAVRTQSTAVREYSDQVEIEGDARAAVITTAAEVTNTDADLRAALLLDTGFQAALAAANSAAGTAFTADYAGLKAIAAYDDATPAPRYASNGYTRATGLLSAAASSANANSPWLRVLSPVPPLLLKSVPTTRPKCSARW